MTNLDLSRFEVQVIESGVRYRVGRMANAKRYLADTSGKAPKGRIAFNILDYYLEPSRVKEYPGEMRNRRFKRA